MLSVLLGSLYIFLQAFLLLFSAAGWAHWIWRIPAIRRHSGDRFFWGFLLAAGFCVGIVGLQHLFYFGCRLGITSWFAFAAAVLGNAGWVLAWRRDRTLSWRAFSELWRAGSVCLVVFLLQSSALFYWGPANYYGGGSIDQINYVFVSQFIVDQPDAFHIKPSDLGTSVFGSIAIRFNNERIGQSVGLGYLAVISYANTKSVYGVFSILMVGFGAAAVCLLVQTLGIPGWAAMLAGCWWGLLPGITKMHLDGFLSQTCYIWALPLSAALFVRHRRSLGAPYLVFQSIYYAYILSVYPEVFIVSVALASGALVFAAQTSYLRRARALVVAPIGGLLGVGLLLTLLPAILAGQYHSATVDVSNISVLVPWSGTWLGWSEIFFGLYFMPPLAQRVIILTSIGLLALMVLGLLCAKRSRRRLLLGLCLVPISVPAVLASSAVFPKYAFAKLLVTFTPFWVLLAVWGCYEARFFLPQAWRRAWMLLVPAGFLLAVIGLALVDDTARWKLLIHNAEPLATVNTPTTRHAYKYAEAHKDASYVVVEDHPHLNAWFVYACRGAKTYVLSENTISDLTHTPYETFWHNPTQLKNAVVLTRGGVLPLDGLKSPALNVSNPPGGGIDPRGTPYYWLGFQPALLDVFVPYSGDASSQWNIHVEVTPIFEVLAPDSEITLTSEDGSVQAIRFLQKSEFQFPVTLHGGVNRLRMQASRPTVAVNRVANDPRRGMIYLQGLFVTPGK